MGILANMSKFLIASCLAMAATVSAEADPALVYAAPALLNSYPNWPGVSTPYSQSTCYGCYGKRSADAEAEPAYLAYGLRPYAYGVHPYAFGVPIGLPHNGAVHGVNQLHPTGHSFQHVSRGKRSADADAEAYYGYPYGYGYRHHGYYGYGYRRGYYYG